MKNLPRILIIMAAVFACLPLGISQTAEQTGAAKAAPGLSGIWMRTGGQRFVPEEAVPLTPWAVEKYKVRREGLPPGAGQGWGELDPMIHCLPHGTPRAYIAPFALEIVQAPRVVYMLFEANSQVRRIYTDGRTVPDGWPPSYMGYSIGRWNGDTLVVETTSLYGGDETWLDHAGTPHSDALRVTERIRRVSSDKMEIDFLFDDPKAYSRPWTAKRVFELKPGWEIMEQSLCENKRRLQFTEFLKKAGPGPRKEIDPFY